MAKNPARTSTRRRDADRSVSSPRARAAERRPAAAVAPRISGGTVGSAIRGRISSTLPGTTLERIARRVLTKRGIDVADIAAVKSMRSLAAPHGRQPLRDVLDAAAPAVPVAPRPQPLGRTPLTVIGADSRERILDTDHYPFSAIAALEIT